ncbi:MAG TPA: TlpA disulfide reductase family protein, partial [Pyrinomonadaceae bacterium]
MMTNKKNLLAQRRNGAAEKATPVFVAPLRRCGSNFLAIVCVCTLMLFAACSESTTTTNTPVISNPPTGTTYPMPPTGTAASLANMGWEFSDGKRSIFSDYRGKVLILDFYATWCAPCRDSIPHLVGLQKKYEAHGLQVVGLNVGGPGDEERVPDFAKQYSIQYQLARPDDDLVTFLLSEQNA